MNHELTCSLRTSIQEALGVVNSKWAYVVISELCPGPKRFNQLQRSIGRISIKSLTDCLRQLEHYKVVKREVFPTVPVSVEYSLTPKGREYGGLLIQLACWNEKWKAAQQI